LGILSFRFGNDEGEGFVSRWVSVWGGLQREIRLHEMAAGALLQHGVEVLAGNSGKRVASLASRGHPKYPWNEFSQEAPARKYQHCLLVTV